MILFWWSQCIVSHGLKQVILDRHGHPEKLLGFNIYLQTAAGLMGQAEERCYHSFCSKSLFPFIGAVQQALPVLGAKPRHTGWGKSAC